MPLRLAYLDGRCPTMDVSLGLRPDAQPGSLTRPPHGTTTDQSASPSVTVASRYRSVAAGGQ